MNKFKICTCLLISFSVSSLYATDLDQRIKEKIFTYQNISNVSKYKGILWTHIPGNFTSSIKIHIPNKKENLFPEINLLSIPDDNFFVTSWVVNSLLTNTYLTSDYSIDTQINNAVIAQINNFSDGNAKDSSLISFWKQVEVKDFQKKYYVAAPQNLLKSIAMLNKICPVKYTFCKNILDSINLTSKAFHIPSDTDDTSLNFAEGAKLYSMQNQFPQAWKTWSENNTPQKIIAALKYINEYAYTPNSHEYNSTNVIDPRSYYVFEKYLATKKNKSNFKLPATWNWSIAKEEGMNPEPNNAPDVAMPLNLNNIDASVIANFLFGASSIITSGYIDNVLNKNQQLAVNTYKLMVNSSEFILYVFSNEIPLDRPDLAMLYYPAKYNVYWFAARTLQHLSGMTLDGKSTKDRSLRIVRSNLSNALQFYATYSLLKQGKLNGKEMYWDDILNHHSDRIYTTAVVINALISTWTEYNHGHLQWLDNTPYYVKDAVHKGVTYLKTKTLNILSSKNNVFFSASVKSMDSLTFWYPANHLYLLKNKNQTSEQKMIIPTNPDDIDKLLEQTNTIIGMKGIINSSNYENLVNNPNFNYPTPTHFNGFQEEGPFPYWTAPVLGYSFSLVAISSYDALSASN
jgi:hypothetical protein